MTFVGACLSCLIAAPAVGQPCLGLRTVGDLIEVTPGPEAIRFGPTVAFSETTQRYVVVFGENKPQPNTNDLFSQVLDTVGGLVGGVNPVIEQEGSQSSHVMTWNSVNNEFLVAWESQAPAGFSSDGRRIGTDGAPLAEPFDLGAAGNELALAFGASTYLFTQRSGGIDGQRLSVAAALLGDVLDIGNGGPNGNVAFDNLNNRFLSVFRSQVGDEFDVRARIVNPDGSFATDPFVVANGFTNHVRAAFDNVNRRYLIVFNGEDSSLRGTLIDENGGPLGPSFLIADEEINFFEVAHNPAGNAFVIVADAGGREDAPEVLAFAVGGDGTVGRDRVVLSTTGGNPAIALNAAAGECLAVWTDGQSRSDTRIVARRLAFGEPACPLIPGCGAGLCGIGICGGGFAPIMPVTLAAMVWMKRRWRGLKVRTTL